MTRTLKIVFLLLGFVLLGWALHTADLSRVFHLMWELGLGFVLVLGIYVVVTWLDSIAWKYGFKPEEIPTVSLWQLWRIRQVGEAYNTITPLGTLGGEPVKAQLLKDHHGLNRRQGIASQVVARTTFLTGLILFFIPGIVLTFQSQQLTENFKHVSLVGMGVFTLLIFLFFLFQLSVSLRHVTAVLSRFSGKEGFQSVLGKVDETAHLMSAYYRRYPFRALVSVGYAFLGWVVGLGELYVILYFLGFDPTWTDVWIMEALSQLVRVGSFFIPLSLGAQESGFILIFMALGLPADLGLTVSFVRRIKELFWVCFGLLMGSTLAFKPARVQPDASEG